jgi:predicted glycoside hydrolase/deacetylase ChbG (UPF0249 family)
MINLIVRAKEFGLCHAANQAIQEGFESGIVTCSSLVVVGPWVAEAVALAHAHPEWEIGLQLVLNCPTAGCRWGPAAGPARVPGLVEPTGTFSPQLAATAKAVEIAQELEAQVERARSWGISPAYLDFAGAASPNIEESIHRLSERLGIPSGTAGWGIHSILPQAPGSIAQLLEALRALPPGVHLWEVWPAHDSPETWGLWPEDEACARQADAQSVCSSEVMAVIRQREIELISFREHTETRVGEEAENE